MIQHRRGGVVLAPPTDVHSVKRLFLLVVVPMLIAPTEGGARRADRRFR